MKPREFDKLIRQKFDQNEFEFNPANWDDLAERMGDDKKKQRSIIVLLMPLLGMAASITVALAIPTIMRMAQPAGYNHAYTSGTNTIESETPADTNERTTTANYTHNLNETHKKHHKNRSTDNESIETDGFKINLKNALGYNQINRYPKIDLLANHKLPEDPKKKKELVKQNAVQTFKTEEQVKVPKVSVAVLGGVNYKNQNNGFILGATTRRMINNKLYIESDVAFVSSNNTTQTAYLVPGPYTSQPVMNTGRTMTSGSAGSSRTATSTSASLNGKNTGDDIIKEATNAYTLYYAEVSPGLGYKLSKKLCIGGGPDFQQMLVDNRPAPSTIDRNNIEVAPIFDIGIMAKSEYAVTKKLKAAMYYHKGINNFLTPMDKYSDRNYMQFQVRYTLFNK